MCIVQFIGTVCFPDVQTKQYHPILQDNCTERNQHEGRRLKGQDDDKEMEALPVA